MRMWKNNTFKEEKRVDISEDMIRNMFIENWNRVGTLIFEKVSLVGKWVQFDFLV